LVLFGEKIQDFVFWPDFYYYLRCILKSKYPLFMKNKIVLATVVCAVGFLFSCQKDSTLPSDSTVVTASDESDIYTETSPTVQTPITRNINSNIGGYLEALPAHYKNHPKKLYPLIIFLHGQGEMGSGSASDLKKVADNAIPELIAKQTFPSNFKVNDTLYQFIVLSPQFKGWPQPVDVKDMIYYATNHYRVNKNRIYVCGLSMGGGGTWDYTWNDGQRIAAIVPISGASWPTTQKAESIAHDTVAVWAFHNNGDPTVPSWYSQDYVDYINESNPAIRAKLTMFVSASHDAWTTATDPNYKENGKNIYEWMLSYKKKRRNRTAFN
jgi:predicted peptidase